MTANSITGHQFAGELRSSGSGRESGNDAECGSCASIYYDTFDRRLLAKNLVLRGDGKEFLISKNRSGKHVALLRSANSMDTAGPLTWREFPAGEFRDRLRKAIGIRALMPLESVGAPPWRASKVSVRPKMKAGTALRKILRAALADIRANRPGTVADIDTEFLHQFRIAVRRTRSVLGLVKGVLPRQVAARYYEEFTWLHDATGTLRDFDVLALEREHFMGLLDPELRPGLEPFFCHLKSRHRDEFEGVRRTLCSRRLHMMLRSWEEFLADKAASSGERAREPVGALARKIIGRRFRAAHRFGRTVGSESPDDDLHALRIRYKKLRYLMQFFAGVFPRKRLRKLMRRLADLQDCLGEFNDRCVQIDVLEVYRREHAQADETAAIDALVSALRERKAETRKDFGKKFRRFAKCKKEFRCLCAS